MLRPELMWLKHPVAMRDLHMADLKLTAIARGDDALDGLARDELAALIWRETDNPTLPNDPPGEGSKLRWVIAGELYPPGGEYYPLGKVFDPAERWMRQSEGRIIALIDLLEDEQDRSRYRGVAVGLSRREDAPEPTDRERAEEAQCRWERVVWLARVLLSARGCGALVQIPLRQPPRAPAQRPLMVVEGGQTEPDGNLAMAGLGKFME